MHTKSGICLDMKQHPYGFSKNRIIYIKEYYGRPGKKITYLTLFECEGVIEFCGMVEGYINYLTFVENLDSRIIDLSMEYFAQRLNRSMVALEKA